MYHVPNVNSEGEKKNKTLGDLHCMYTHNRRQYKDALV